MELDVIRQRTIQHAQHIAAESRSRRTAQAVVSPHFTDGMFAALAPLQDLRQAATHRFRVAQDSLQLSRTIDGQLLIQEREQFVVGELDRHGGISEAKSWREIEESAGRNACLTSEPCVGLTRCSYRVLSLFKEWLNEIRKLLDL